MHENVFFNNSNLRSTKHDLILFYCWSTVYDAGAKSNQHWVRVSLVSNSAVVRSWFWSRCIPILRLSVDIYCTAGLAISFDSQSINKNLPGVGTGRSQGGGLTSTVNELIASERINPGSVQQRLAKNRAKAVSSLENITPTRSHIPIRNCSANRVLSWSRQRAKPWAVVFRGNYLLVEESVYLKKCYFHIFIVRLPGCWIVLYSGTTLCYLLNK